MSSRIRFLSRSYTVGTMVGISLHDLFDAQVSSTPVTFEELSSRVARFVERSGLSVDDAGERVGWELRDVLANPSAFWDFNVDGLRDVCNAIGVNWADALPRRVTR